MPQSRTTATPGPEMEEKHKSKSRSTDRARAQLISEDQAVAPRILAPGGAWTTRVSQKEMGDSEPGSLSPARKGAANKTKQKADSLLFL